MKKWRAENKDKVKAQRDRNRNTEYRKNYMREYNKTEKRRLYTKNYGKNYYLKNKYGITVEIYDSLLKSQDNRCAICNRHISEIKSNLVIDHNHTTGAVRGLLCSRCNTGIGQLGDSVDLLEKAIQYLKDGE